MKQLGKLLLASFWRFNRNDGWAHSSHIALSLLIALFPFCSFSLALAVYLSPDVGSDQIVDLVLGTWPPQLSEPIARDIAAVLESDGAATLTASAILTLFFASNGVDAIRTSITGAYNETDPRPFWKTQLLCIAFVIFGALVLTVASVLLVVLPGYFEFVKGTAPDLYANVFSSEPLRITISMALLILLLVSSHLWLPGLDLSLASVMPGVALTIVLWVICAQGFAFYIATFETYSVTYAGLAGIMASLVFMYMMAAIFLYGAEFNGQLAEDFSAP